MWQRFTERARKVVFYAQEEAQKYGDGYVSTEHLLLGLLREPTCVAAQVIERLGVSPVRVRSEVESLLPRSEAKSSGDMTLTPRAKRVIDLAYDEARNLNNNYIGTEHLLLGLIREGDGLAARVLHTFGVTTEDCRPIVEDMQAKEGQVKPPIQPEPVALNSELQATLRHAQSIAQEHGCHTVGFEHWLYAVVVAETSATRDWLVERSVDIDALRRSLELLFSESTPIVATQLTISMTIQNAIADLKKTKQEEVTGVDLIVKIFELTPFAGVLALGAAGLKPEHVRQSEAS